MEKQQYNKTLKLEKTVLKLKEVSERAINDILYSKISLIGKWKKWKKTMFAERSVFGHNGISVSSTNMFEWSEMSTDCWIARKA